MAGITSKRSHKKETKMATATQEPKSTKPGTEGEVKKEKPVKVAHPALKVDDEGNSTVKIDSVPDGYSKKKHLPLRRNDFTSTEKFYEFRAAEALKQHNKYKQLAEDERNLGSKEERQKKKRLLKLTEQIEALKAEFAASGQNVDELIASLQTEE